MFGALVEQLSSLLRDLKEVQLIKPDDRVVIIWGNETRFSEKSSFCINIIISFRLEEGNKTIADIITEIFKEKFSEFIVDSVYKNYKSGQRFNQDLYLYIKEPNSKEPA